MKNIQLWDCGLLQVNWSWAGVERKFIRVCTIASVGCQRRITSVSETAAKWTQHELHVMLHFLPRLVSEPFLDPISNCKRLFLTKLLLCWTAILALQIIRMSDGPRWEHFFWAFQLCCKDMKLGSFESTVHLGQRHHPSNETLVALRLESSFQHTSNAILVGLTCRPVLTTFWICKQHVTAETLPLFGWPGGFVITMNM